MILFRPTGLRELELVRDSGWRAWSSVFLAPDSLGFRAPYDLEQARRRAQEDLQALNSKIRGLIEVVAAYRDKVRVDQDTLRSLVPA